MNAPVEIALAAWARPYDPDDREANIRDAFALAETGVFSKTQIALITRLPFGFTQRLLEKSTRDGGRFDPEMLPQLHDLWANWNHEGICDLRALRMIIAGGASYRMVAKLTGIPKTTIHRWVMKP